MSAPILVSTEQKVATLAINREQRRNSLDHTAVAAFRDALQECTDGDVSVIVIRGAGDKAFCAGDDIKAYAERTRPENRKHHATGLRLLEAIEEHPCLVVAAIEGFCLGGGLELAICCDYRIAGESATFGLPEVRKLNVLPSWGGLTRLPKLIGMARAKSLVLMGERHTAAEAQSMGLVNEAVTDGEAYDTAHRLAIDYAKHVDRSTIELAKRTLLNADSAPGGTARFLNELVDAALGSDEILGAGVHKEV
ncbi:MAG: enoyl-CoA hydratase/isomerase family protein [Gammaproteobacteria bacterium]